MKVKGQSVGAEGQGNEGDETSRARRNGSEATSDCSQASSGAGPKQHTSGDREISFANNFSARPRLPASMPRAGGEGEIAGSLFLLVGNCIHCFRICAHGDELAGTAPPGRPSWALY